MTFGPRNWDAYITIIYKQGFPNKLNTDINVNLNNRQRYQYSRIVNTSMRESIHLYIYNQQQTLFLLRPA